MACSSTTPNRACQGLDGLRFRLESQGVSPETQGGVLTEVSDGTVVLDNGLLRVEIGADGTLHRV